MEGGTLVKVTMADSALLMLFIFGPYLSNLITVDPGEEIYMPVSHVIR